MGNEYAEVIEGLTQITSTLFQEVMNLKQDNAKLQSQVAGQEELIHVLIDNQKKLTASLDQTKTENKMLADTMIRSINNVPYELGRGVIPVPKVASFDETIQALVSADASIGRFGDGEFSIMAGYCRQKFQHYDERLAQKLRQVLESRDDGFMVAIADNYGSLYQYNENCRNQIRYYMTDKIRAEHNRFLSGERVYYNAHITSMYQMARTENEKYVGGAYEKIKSVWEHKNVIMIEGRLSRVGVGNDLFDKACGIKRILCPPEHAFDQYDEILNAALQTAAGCENVIFLISLGPAGTVLAYELFKAGYRALDLGHMDIDYELFTKGTKDLSAIRGKHINNYNAVDEIGNLEDKRYESQIVLVVS